MMFSRKSIQYGVTDLFINYLGIIMNGLPRLTSTVSKILAGLNLLLWAGVLIKSATKAYYFDIYQKSDITDDLKTFRFAVGFQIFTTIIQMLNYPSILFVTTTFAKILLETLTCWYFLESTTDHYTFLFLAIVWSSWQFIIKVSFFAPAEIQIRELLSNTFFVLNPLQTYTMYQVIRTYQARNKETLSEGQNTFAWGCIVALIILKFYTYARRCMTMVKSMEKDRIRNEGKTQ